MSKDSTQSGAELIGQNNRFAITEIRVRVTGSFDANHKRAVSVPYIIRFRKLSYCFQIRAYPTSRATLDYKDEKDFSDTHSANGNTKDLRKLRLIF